MPFPSDRPTEAKRPLLPEAWRARVGPALDEDWFRGLWAFVQQERERGTVYPPRGQVFRALELTSPDAVRAVILGQDPYHGPGQAHGLAFSVPDGVAPPPSLRNIFRELGDDLDIETPQSGCLEPWARRGVLLLNTILTVRHGEAGAHAGAGWERFTDRILRAVSDGEDRVVFVLWGNPARAKKDVVRRPPHAVVESAHPSPLSAHRGFLGSRPFSKVNRLLAEEGRAPIDWRLPG